MKVLQHCIVASSLTRIVCTFCCGTCKYNYIHDMYMYTYIVDVYTCTCSSAVFKVYHACSTVITHNQLYVGVRVLFYHHVSIALKQSIMFTLPGS